MTTQSPTHAINTTKSPVNDARFWYCVVESIDVNGKVLSLPYSLPYWGLGYRMGHQLDYEKLAEKTGYKNWNSAKVAFFTKRKQMRLDEVKGEDGVRKERKVDAGVKKGGRKKGGRKKETITGRKKEDEKGFKDEMEEDEKGFKQEVQD